MNKEEARKMAVKLATEKGWEKNEVSYLTKDGDFFVFYLYMPQGDFGYPCGVVVSENVCEIRELTSQEILLLRQD